MIGLLLGASGSFAAAPNSSVQGIALRNRIHFSGNLQDTVFPAATPIRLEVLETGDTLNFISGKGFKIDLVPDTVWNLCFQSATPAITEKCYELKYTGNDSAFSATLGGNGLVLENKLDTTLSLSDGSLADSSDLEASDAVARTEETVQLKKVLVRAQRAPKRSLGKSTVSAKLIKRLPGLAEADVIRSIQGLPGVVSSSDFSTKIYVRGGGSDQNLILFDKAVVYSPVHFFGLFSTFLVEGIDEVNFYKGGFPSEYGNRLSSVLDIKSRKGGKDTADSWAKGSSIKISTFASQLHTEGRQGPVSWLIAGRRTYIDQVLTAFRDQGLTDLDLDYFFYDVQGNVNYNLGKGRNLMFSGYNGRDLLDFTPFKVEWGNTVLPFNYSGIIDKDLSTQATASYSHFSQKFGLENIFQFYNRIVTWNYKQSFEYTGIDSHKLSIGVDLNYMQTIFSNTSFVAKVTSRDETNFYLNNLFLQDKWTFGEAEVTSGLRISQSSTLDLPGIEPRLSLKYKLPKGQSLDLHIGYYEQYINSILISDQETINEFYYPAKKAKYRTVNPTTSILFSAGYARDKIFDRFDFTLEGYYKTLNHLLIFAPNDKPDSIRNNPDLPLGDRFKEASGYSYGWEISLRKPEGLIFGGLSYSRGTSVILEENDTGSYFPNWHQPHSFKADLAINWTGKDGLWRPNKKGKYFRSSMQLKYATGLPFTEFIGYSPTHLYDQNQGKQAGGPNPEFDGNINIGRGNRNASSVPAYFRWDAKVVDWGRENKWNFSFTILNLTNHKNIFFYSYDRAVNPPKFVEIPQFPLFPLLFNYEYYF